MQKDSKNGDIARVSESINWINLELTENEKKHIDCMKQANEDLKNIHQLTMIPKEYFGKK